MIPLQSNILGECHNYNILPVFKLYFGFEALI